LITSADEKILSKNSFQKFKPSIPDPCHICFEMLDQDLHNIEGVRAGMPGVPHELEYGGLLARVPGFESESAVLEVFDGRES